MAKIVVDNNVTEVLEVVIGDKTYNVPLGSSLSYKELKELDTNEKMLAFFIKHIPEDVFETLSFGNIAAIMNEWRKATEQASGISLGH